jgi:hypothetical protein
LWLGTLSFFSGIALPFCVSFSFAGSLPPARFRVSYGLSTKPNLFALLCNFPTYLSQVQQENETYGNVLPVNIPCHMSGEINVSLKL